MATLDQALQQVEAATTREVQDPEISVTAANAGLLHEPWFDLHLSDSHIMTPNEPELSAQATMLGNLHACMATGRRFEHMIYATRSASKAIPQVKSSDQPNRMQLYEETVNTLKPEVDKMREFLEYHKHAVGLVGAICNHMNVEYCKAKRELSSVPEDLVLTLARMLGLLFSLDNLVSVKSAWKNDFSAWKRASSNLKKMDQNDMVVNQELHFFLANNYSVLASLKKQLDGQENSKEILAHIMNVCVDCFEDEMYIAPNDKFILLKAIAYGIALIDQGDPRDPKNDERLSITKVKRLRLDRTLKVLKRWPIVPLTGDMQVALPIFLKVAPHIDEKLWTHETEEGNVALTDKYLIVYRIETFRKEFTEYMSELTVLDEAMKRGEVKADVLGNLLKGVKLLSSWTSAVLEQAAWKFAHPTDRYTNRECPEEATSYEKVVRYAYRSKDRTVLLELIVMIKDLHKTLSNRMGTEASSIIKTYIHHHVQSLLHTVVQPLLQYCNKKKRKEAAKVLVAMYTIASDMDFSVDTAKKEGGPSKTKQHGRKQFALPQGTIQLPTRACGPTSTQIFFLRSIVGSLLNEAGGGKSALMKEKDFEPEQMATVRNFYRLSYFFEPLLDFEETLRQCSDLSWLWYKEFYLELAKEIQFPIEMSLPWILASDAVENPSYVELSYYPLELYNDAASFALNSLQSQYMYDEIEAEVNLCFDQLVFEITQAVFAFAKAQATSNMLDKGFKARLVASDPSSKHRYDVMPQQLEGLLNQTHVSILGRSVDVRRLVSQGIQAIFRKSVDTTIGMFESEDVTGVLGLEWMLENCRQTHIVLSRYIAMDPFSRIMAERNRSMDPASHYGRIEHKILFEILFDLIPHYCFHSLSQEFTRTLLPMAEVIERDAPPKASAIHLYGNKSLMPAVQLTLDATKGPFTMEHAAAICRFIGSQKFGALINELCQAIGLQLHAVIKPYVDSLLKGMPKEIKMPDLFYGTSGSFSYFQALLKPILQYPDLSTEVYQAFRCIGNTFALISVLEQALELTDILDATLVQPFARCDAPVRQVRLPQTNAPLGFVLAGGLEQHRPIVVSKVDPGSVAAEAGLAIGDEVLAVNGIDFRSYEKTNKFIEHAVAVQILQTNPGATLTVKNINGISYNRAVGRHIASVGEENADSLFKWRCDNAGPLHNAISPQGSVFKGAMHELNNILNSTKLRQEWTGARPTNDVLDFGTTPFFRLWSALQFAFCVPTGNTMNPETIFGDGLQWGGLALVYLLGQNQKFSALDYVYHILRVSEEDPKWDNVGAVKIPDFIAVGLRIQSINNRFFTLMQLHFPEPCDHSTVYGICHPPRRPGEQGKYESYDGEYGRSSNALAAPVPIHDTV